MPRLWIYAFDPGIRWPWFFWVNPWFEWGRNAKITPGQSVLPTPLGGSFADHAYGRGGSDGSYDARKGRVTNPSGNTYAYADYLPADCTDHPEANGEAGFAGAVILVPMPVDPEIRKVMVTAVEDKFLREVSGGLGTSEADENTLTELASFVSETPNGRSVFAKTLEEIEAKRPANALTHFLKEGTEAIGEQPKIFDRVQEAGAPVWLIWLVEAAFGWLMWENSSVNVPPYEELLQERYDGWSIEMLGDDLKSVDLILNAYDKVLSNPEALEAFTPRQLDLLKHGKKTYQARREALQRELRARFLQQQKSDIAKDRAERGLGAADDPNVGRRSDAGNVDRFLDRVRGRQRCITTYVGNPGDYTQGQVCYYPH